MFFTQVNTTSLVKMFSYIDWTLPFMVSLIASMTILIIVSFASAYYRKTRGYLMMFIAALAVSSDLITEIFMDSYEFLGLSPKVFNDNGYFTFVFWTIPTVFMLCILSTSVVAEFYQNMSKSE